jgi:hypothetical protein
MLGQIGYAAIRKNLLAQTGVLACQSDADCTLLSDNANCGDACAATPVSATSAPAINSQLSSYATNNCSTCTALIPPCAAPLPPVCKNALCATAAFDAAD